MFPFCKLFKSSLFYLFIGFMQVFGDNNGTMEMYMSDATERTPRLEDFFWTGSGDGPPPPMEVELPASVPAPTLVHTTTVLATVYLDSYPAQAVTDRATGECVLNCETDVVSGSVPGSLEPDMPVPEDRRYWLLTVIKGSTPDGLQLRLARLYQKAFLRQQERHLGIIKSLDAPTTRKKHDVHSFHANKDNEIYPSNSDIPLRYHDVQSSMIGSEDFSRQTSVNNVINIKATPVMNLSQFVATNVSKILSNNIDFSIDFNSSIKTDIKTTRLDQIANWVLATPTLEIMKREITTDREELKNEDYKEELIDITLEEEEISNATILFKREIIKPEQQPPVHVQIQNITEYTETGNVQIVYVVLVGGRAVPAAVAARDMRLVRDAEVARELGATVTTKAEPAYLKSAEGLAGEESAGTTVHGTELWALAVGTAVAVLLLLMLLVLLCRLARRKKAKSAASLHAYRNEIMREVERNQLKQVHEEKDGRLISVVSPSRTRPNSTLLPVYRAGSASSTTSSGVSEVAAALRRRQRRPHALRMAQKKRVGTTDSLLVAAGLGDSSDSGREPAPHTPTSYLSMPSVRSFPRGNIVEPLSRVLEPVSVRHLDIDSAPEATKEMPKTAKSKPQERVHGKSDPMNPEAVPRRQMASQLIRLGSIDKDPGVVGPLVWDLHCQRIKDASKPSSPKASATPNSGGANVSRMRQRFNELVDDAFSLFSSPASSPKSAATFTIGGDKDTEKELAQARNDNVRLPGSPYTALDTVRGRSAGGRGVSGTASAHRPVEQSRPVTSFTRPHALERRAPPARAWDVQPQPSSAQHPAPVVNPALILSEGRLPPEDPALPLISAIKSEIQRVREHKPNDP